ncbi:MAG: DNA polymerase III subunit delta, partial [Verrucomicrobiae bacterium]|nr:DNA polymerase III subunit delta [Verrucomicrobiae bacterium]
DFFLFTRRSRPFTSAILMTASAASFYLFAGSNEAMVKDKARACVETLAKKVGDFGLETIDAGAENADHVERICAQCLEALNTLPFMGGEKVVWLKNCNFLADNVLARTRAATEGTAQIAEFIKAGIPAGVYFVVSALGIDRRKSFYKSAEKAGEVFFFEAPDMGKRDWQEQVETQILEGVRAAGKTMDEEASLLLADMVGGDSMTLRSELEKLLAYCGENRRIRVEDVQAICTASREQIVWELADSVAERDGRRAVTVLGKLLSQGESGIGLLFGLISRFRHLLIVRELMTQKALTPVRSYGEVRGALARIPEEIKSRLPADKKMNPLANHEFVVFKLMLNAQKYSRAELVRALDILFQTNLKLVRSSLEEQLLMETAILQIVRK